MSDDDGDQPVAEVAVLPVGASAERRRLARRQGGRPSVLTESTIDNYAAALHAGATKGQAAHAVGIHPSTVRKWAQRVEAIYGTLDQAYTETFDDEPVEDGHQPTIGLLIEFFAHATRAEQNAIVERLASIRRHGVTDWRADAWYLERRYPEEFGKTTKVEHSTPDEPVVVRVTFDGREDRAIDVPATEVDVTDGRATDDD